MSASKGIKMGVDPVMPNEGELYDGRKGNKEYVTSINPNGDSDSDEDIVQQIQDKRAKYDDNNNPYIPFSTSSLSSLHHNIKYSRSKPSTSRESLMKTDNEDIDFDPMSQKHKQIQSKNNEYQNRAFDRGLTPARADPFANVANTNSSSSNQPSQSTRREISDSRKEIVKDQPRSYRDIMAMRNAERTQKEAKEIIAGKRSKFSDQLTDDDDTNHNKKSSSTLGKRKYASTVCIISILSLHLIII